MRNLVALFKLFLFSFVLINFFVLSLPLLLLSLYDRYLARKYMAYVLQLSTYLGCKLFNMNVTVNDPFHAKKIKGLIVSNHLSYLDIIASSPYMPSCFITSLEMRKAFFLGQIVEAAGCVFVDRKSKKNINDEILDITKALTSELDVTLFPEATSTNGEAVKPFKRSLFFAAINSEAYIKPMTINYTTLDGVKTSKENRDKVCWYGDMEFFPHLWSFLKLKRIDISLDFARPIKVNKASDSKELAVQVYDIVSSNYKVIT